MTPIKIDQLVRSKRKSIALIVDNEGRLIVRAPLHMPRQAIDSFILEKFEWIVEKQAKARREREGCEGSGPPYKFQEGERFWFLGGVYSLSLVAAQPHALLLDGGFRLRRAEQSRGRQVFEAWYKAQARAYFNRRTAELAHRYGYQYHSIRLSSARARWGSCSSRGSINLTWRLIMAPPEVIDSVITHELVHLEIKNHSRQFWLRLEQLMPDYKTHRKWLNDNTRCLDWA